MENILHLRSKLTFKRQSSFLQNLTAFVKNSHAKRQKKRLEKQMEQDLLRLSETSFHLLEDIGFTKANTVDAAKINCAAQTRPIARF